MRETKEKKGETSENCGGENEYGRTAKEGWIEEEEEAEEGGVKRRDRECKIMSRE